jgi:hypothetical protein
MAHYNNYKDVDVLKGKTITRITNVDNYQILIETDDGHKYKMYHQQDCCESVCVDDISGDLQDLVGSPLLVAEEVSNEDFEKQREEELRKEEKERGWSSVESESWTFYKFATINGYVDIRWHGSSNGYYSERVDFVQTYPKDED